MAEFEVKNADGAVFKITAPDTASAMKAWRSMQGGGAPDAPEAAPSPSPAMDAAQANIASGGSAFDSLKGKVEDRTAIPGNAGHLIAQGLSFGTADEINAGVNSLGALFTDETVGDAYDRNLMEERAAVENYRRDYPYRAMGYEAAGAVLPAMTGVGALGTAATTGARVGAAAGSGAVGGGIYGFNAGEGGAVERLKDAGTGAAFGAAGGAILGGAVEGGRRALSAVRGRGLDINIPQGGNAETRAVRQLSDALKDDAIEPGALSQALVAGKPQTLLDVSGTATQQLGGAAARKSPQVKGELDRLFTSRQEGSQGRVLDDIQSLNQGRDPRSFKATQAAATDARGKEAAKRYRKAYQSEAVATSPQLLELMRRPSVQKAVASAPARAAERGRDVRVSKETLEMMDTLKNETPEERAIFNEISEYRADIEAFESAVGEVAKRADDRFKKPAFREIIRRGGIDPQSPVASELRNMGITSRSMPGIYRRGGLRDLDNLPASEMREIFGDNVGNGRYASRQGILDTLEDEFRTGAPTRTPEQEAANIELKRMMASEPEIEELRKIVSDYDVSRGAQSSAIPSTNLTAEGWDMVLRELGEGIEAATAKGQGDQAQALTATKAAIEREIEILYPDLKAARAAFSDASESINAGDAGRKFLQGDSDKIVGEFSGLSDAGKAAAQQGAARALVDKVARKRPEQSAADPLRTLDVEDRLNEIFPGEDVATFRTRLDAEKGMANTRNSVLGNSLTAERLAADEQFSGGALSRALRAVSDGGVFGAINSATQDAGIYVSDALALGVSRKKAEEIGKLIADPDVAAVIKKILSQRAVDADYTPADRSRLGAALVGMQSERLSQGTP